MPTLQSWFQYDGKFSSSNLNFPILSHLNVITRKSSIILPRVFYHIYSRSVARVINQSCLRLIASKWAVKVVVQFRQYHPAWQPDYDFDFMSCRVIQRCFQLWIFTHIPLKNCLKFPHCERECQFKTLLDRQCFCFTKLNKKGFNSSTLENSNVEFSPTH